MLHVVHVTAFLQNEHIEVKREITQNALKLEEMLLGSALSPIMVCLHVKIFISTLF